MDKKQREQYEAPVVNEIDLKHELSLLLSFSVEGDVEDIEESNWDWP